MSENCYGIFRGVTLIDLNEKIINIFRRETKQYAMLKIISKLI